MPHSSYSLKRMTVSFGENLDLSQSINSHEVNIKIIYLPILILAQAISKLFIEKWMMRVMR